MIFSFTSRQVLQADDLVFIVGNRATSAVLAVFVDKIVPFRFRSTFTAAPLHFDLVDRQPTVFWGDVVGEIGFDSTALLDAFPGGAAADGFDSVFSDEAVGAWLWINAWSTFTNVLEAAVGRAGNSDSVKCFWSNAVFVWDDLTFTGPGGTADSGDFRKDFLVSIAFVVISDRWAFADLFSAAVGGADNWNGLEDLW